MNNGWPDMGDWRAPEPDFEAIEEARLAHVSWRAFTRARVHKGGEGVAFSSGGGGATSGGVGNSFGLKALRDRSIGCDRMMRAVLIVGFIGYLWLWGIGVAESRARLVIDHHGRIHFS